MEIVVAYDHPRWEEKSLYKALSGLGHSVVMVNISRTPLEEGPGCVVVRPVSLTRAYYTALYYEYHGASTINRSSVIRIAGDKIETLLVMEANGIPVPKTIIALSGDASLRAGETLGYPLVDKPPVGSWGRLVSLVRDKSCHREVIEHRGMLQYPNLHIHLVQEYVGPGGRDIRCLYSNGGVLGCMERIAPRGEWRSNVARGASTRPYTGKDAEELAARAAEAIGGGLVSVDLLESDRGLLVNEVNGVPEFRGLTNTIGRSIIQGIVEGIIDACRR